jgi:hypothetical protein
LVPSFEDELSADKGDERNCCELLLSRIAVDFATAVTDTGSTGGAGIRGELRALVGAEVAGVVGVEVVGVVGAGVAALGGTGIRGELRALTA